MAFPTSRTTEAASAQFPASAHHLPDYRGGGIVNLMSSIVAAAGGDAQPYPRLAVLDDAFLTQARHIVLLVIDGLGYDYLASAGAGSCLHSHLQAKLTSVFPSTTASAATCLLSAQPAQQSGLSGWHMYYRELGAIAAVLPLQPRHGGAGFVSAGIAVQSLLSGQVLFDHLDRPCHVVAPANIVDSDFNRYYAGTARRTAYTTLDTCFAAVTDYIRTQPGRSYTHAYYPVIDAASHAFGCRSDAVAQRFARLDQRFAAFVKSLAGSDTAIVVTADHGFIDSPPEHLIEMAQHPELAQMLTLPLCGERRVAYCYVHPHRQTEFESYVTSEFAGRARLLRSDEMLAQGWFGLGAAHPRLHQRIGDYTLLLQDDWTIKDWVEGEPRHANLGVHGGTSAAEMFVPLIVALA